MKPLILEQIDQINTQLADIVTLKPSGGDDTIALTNALANVSDGGKITLSKGTFTFNGSIDKALNKGITIIGEKGTIIDGSNSADSTLIHLYGSRGISSALSSDAVKSANLIVSSLTVTKGDILLITSTDLWNPSRAYYYKGEIVEVESVSGNNITIKQPLNDFYTAITTTIYKLNMPKIIVKDVEIKRNSNQAGLKIEYAKDINLENVTITGARERCFDLNYIYGGVLINNVANDAYYTGSGTSYGLCISSSQYINIIGGKYLSGRHGISHGGSEPCRFINIIGAIVGNDKVSGMFCLDAHGNTEFITVSNCTILNGIDFVGTNYIISENKIYNMVIFEHEVGKNGSITVKDNTIDSSFEGIKFDYINSDLSFASITLKDNIINSSSDMIKFTPHSATIQNIVIDNVNIENINGSTSTTNKYAFEIIFLDSTKLITVKKLTLKDIIIKSVLYRCFMINIIGDILIDNCKIYSGKASDYANIIQLATNITIINSIFDSNLADKSVFQCSQTFKFINNKLYNFGTSKGLDFSGNVYVSYAKPTLAILRDNEYVNCVGTLTKGTVTTYSYINQDGTSVS